MAAMYQGMAERGDELTVMDPSVVAGTPSGHQDFAPLSPDI
jgi:hypothetical protein